MLAEIEAHDFLSFGAGSEPLKLQALNVLIGPNGSGKSNMIEAISVLRSTASDVSAQVMASGGGRELVHKGDVAPGATITARIHVGRRKWILLHTLRLSFIGMSQLLVHERIERIEDELANIFEDSPLFDSLTEHPPTLTVDGKLKALSTEELDFRNSVLVQYKSRQAYPELTFLSGFYQSIQLFRQWQIGFSSVFRQPQRADARNDRLEEDFSNLGLFLNGFEERPTVKRKLVALLQDVNPAITDYGVSVKGGTVQLFLTEANYTVPAIRLSDGTLRYLALLAILCDPTPPPLICIEEPELGLHPDILPKLADLLIEASERTQLIVTTHSDILVDALSDHPECIVVCEKHEGETKMRRLERSEVEPWLEKYRLGQLWTRGEIGGTRW